MQKQKFIRILMVIFLVIGFVSVVQAKEISSEKKKPAFSFLKRFFKSQKEGENRKKTYLQKFGSNGQDNAIIETPISSQESQQTQGNASDSRSSETKPKAIDYKQRIIGTRGVGHEEQKLTNALENVYIFTVNVPPVDLSEESGMDGKVYYRVKCKGCQVSTEPGKPKLPYFKAGSVAIPLDAKDVKVEIVDTDISTKNLGRILPALAEEPGYKENKDTGAIRLDYKFYKDEEFFASKAIYPQERVFFDQGNFRGVGFVDVMVSPAQYSVSDNTLATLEGKITIKVKWKDSGKEKRAIDVGKTFSHKTKKMHLTMEDESELRRSSQPDFNTAMRQEITQSAEERVWDPAYDLNCDGKVNLSDLGSYARVYFNYQGEVNAPEGSLQYCSDFNADGFINDQDIPWFADHYGTEGPVNCCVQVDHPSQGMVTYIENLEDIVPTIDYLIITADALYDLPDLEVFAEFRADQSKMHVAIAKASDVYDMVGTVIDRDPLVPSLNWEKEKEIKTFIKQVYDQGQNELDYVLLVGRAANVADASEFYVPQRLSVFTEPTRSDKPIRGDYYYGCLNDDNGDDEIDDYDMTWDVAVGRFSVRSHEELKNVIHKTMNFPGDFADTIEPRVLLTNGFDGNHAWYDYLDEMTEEIFAPNNVATHLVEAPDIAPDYMDFVNLTADQANEGYGFWVHNSHGQPWGWEIGPEGSEDMITFGRWAVQYFQNENRYPFVISIACSTGLNYWATEPGFGETMLAKYPYGAAGFVGATGIAYLYASDDLMERMLQLIYEEEIYTVGDLVSEGKMAISSHPSRIGHRILYNLYGDPALNIRDAITWAEEEVEDPPEDDPPPDDPPPDDDPCTTDCPPPPRGINIRVE